MYVSIAGVAEGNLDWSGIMLVAIVCGLYKQGEARYKHMCACTCSTACMGMAMLVDLQ